MKYIDLSMTIKNHWRWPVEHTFPLSYEKGDEFQTSHFKFGAHAFTHVDTPLHCKPGGESVEQMSVDAYCGTASVIDISYKKANEPITEQDMADNGKHVKENDIILIKTCWDEIYPYDTKEYWREAPYFTDEAAIWLQKQKPKAVGFDFPQDFPLKTVDKPLEKKMKDYTTHKYLLDHNILHIEYLCNMKEVTQERVELIALPLKIEGAEGGPVRVVAIEK